MKLCLGVLLGLVPCAVGAAAGALVCLVACGGSGWTTSDTATATDAVHAQMMLEELCAPDAACRPSDVRALERMALCADSSRLAAHGAPVPDSGINCKAP